MVAQCRQGRGHKQPIYGTKQQLWRRALSASHELLQKEVVQAELARQLEERWQGAPQMPAVPLRYPKPPTDAERSEHELTHAKFMPWCEFCIMGKGTEEPHRRVDQEDKEQSGPEIQMDIAHLKTDGSHYAKGEEVNFSNVWCSHLVGVDRGI